MTAGELEAAVWGHGDAAGEVATIGFSISKRYVRHSVVHLAA